MLKKIILVLFSVLLVVYLLRQIDPREMYRVIVNIKPAYLAAGLAMFVAGHLIRAYRFSILLNGKVPMKSLFSIIAVQTAAVGFMPFRSGEFSLIYLLKRDHDVEYPLGAATLILAKVLDFLVVVPLFFISFGSLSVIPEFFRELLPWAGGLFFLTLASLFMLGRGREIYAKLPNFFKEGPIPDSALMVSVKKVFKAAEVIRSKKTLAASLGVTVFLWVFLYGFTFLVYLGVGLKFSLLEMTFITTAMSIFSNLPIHSPGAFGTTESFWTLMLSALGVPKPMGIATGFATHIISILFTLLFMLYGLELVWKRKAKAN